MKRSNTGDNPNFLSPASCGALLEEHKKCGTWKKLSEKANDITKLSGETFRQAANGKRKRESTIIAIDKFLIERANIKHHERKEKTETHEDLLRIVLLSETIAPEKKIAIANILLDLD